MTDYWNHNTAYHPWIMDVASERSPGRVLDIGCGEGLLVERLSPLVGHITGIEPDSESISRTRTRIDALPNADAFQSSFADFQAPDGAFDLITCVATLHHMPLSQSLIKARELLAPGGDLLVVGLSAPKGFRELLLSAAQLIPVRIGSALHRETPDIGVPVTTPAESLAEIRSTASVVLPGAHIRRALYYRYLLRWTKPGV